MKVSESVAPQCRYGEFVDELYGDYEVIEDKSDADWQGMVYLLAKKNDRYIYVQFYYGSCSGCDDWEQRELTDDQIKNEIIELTLQLNEKEYIEWRGRVKQES